MEFSRISLYISMLLLSMLFYSTLSPPLEKASYVAVDRKLSVVAATTMRPIVALAVSGSSRGSLSLHRFANAMRSCVIIPAAANYDFHAFLWLQDAAAEDLLHRALADSVRIVSSRREALSDTSAQPPSGSQGPESELSAISVDHEPSTLSQRLHLGKAEEKSAEHGVQRLNTLRMLHKLRGVEWLRLHTLSKLGGGVTHTWVLRIRPDLELLTDLPLPPPLPDLSLLGGDVRVPWLCHMESLASDQLLLLSTAGSSHGAAGRLGGLYEPAQLSRAVAASDPHSLYPERVVWHALDGFKLRMWTGAALSLVSDSGGARDPYAKVCDAHSLEETNARARTPTGGPLMSATCFDDVRTSRHSLFPIPSQLPCISFHAAPQRAH